MHWLSDDGSFSCEPLATKQPIDTNELQYQPGIWPRRQHRQEQQQQQPTGTTITKDNLPLQGMVRCHNRVEEAKSIVIGKETATTTTTTTREGLSFLFWQEAVTNQLRQARHWRAGTKPTRLSWTERRTVSLGHGCFETTHEHRCSLAVARGAVSMRSAVFGNVRGVG